MQKKFNKDLETIYNLVGKRDDEISKFYDILQDNRHDKREFFEEFLNSQGIKIDNDSLFAIVSRIVNLRDDSLTQILKKQDFNEKDTILIKENAYIWVKNYYLQEHKKLIDNIKQQELLSPFYQEVLSGIYNVGVAISSWQSSWTATIIDGVNLDLKRRFKKDEYVHNYLTSHSLEADGDRSYSILKKNIQNRYKVKTYIEAFDECKDVVDRLKEFYSNLLKYEDKIFNQKNEYLIYLDALIKAFSESQQDKVISKWTDVDRAWMSITTPIQIGHPLEYYEDHYRKAVALEWDLRLSNPNIKNSRVDKIKLMFETIYNSIGEDYNELYKYNLANLDKVQLYLGRPALFFGAEFNGLFSAQVVPNDEDATKEFGKKIFAFADKILQSSRAKPYMKLPRKIYGDEFVKSERKFLEEESQKWHQLYDISTIGHEYGHTLWMSDSTESMMNKSGNFKNIEEFKATTGGLVSFFLNEEDGLELKVLTDVMKRAVGLIGWMEVGEVEPYYCEGLIHLDILFNSKVLNFEHKKLTLDISKNSYKRAKELYISTYTLLAKEYYLKQIDANEFLKKYTIKEDKYFLPKNKKIKEFVEYYYELYQSIGTQLDESQE